MRQWLGSLLYRWSLWLDPGLAPPADQSQEIADLRYQIELWMISSREMEKRAAEWQVKAEAKQQLPENPHQIENTFEEKIAESKSTECQECASLRAHLKAAELDRVENLRRHKGNENAMRNLIGRQQQRISAAERMYQQQRMKGAESRGIRVVNF